MTHDDDRLPTQVTTRLPAALADELHAIARAEKRSLSNLLLLAAESYVDQYKARIVSEG